MPTMWSEDHHDGDEMAGKQTRWLRHLGRKGLGSPPQRTCPPVSNSGCRAHRLENTPPTATYGRRPQRCTTLQTAMGQRRNAQRGWSSPPPPSVGRARPLPAPPPTTLENKGGGGGLVAARLGLHWFELTNLFETIIIYCPLHPKVFSEMGSPGLYIQEMHTAFFYFIYLTKTDKNPYNNHTNWSYQT
jgi:hypothetical protein